MYKGISGPTKYLHSHRLLKKGSLCHRHTSHSHKWKHSYTNSMSSIFCRIHHSHSHYDSHSHSYYLSVMRKTNENAIKNRKHRISI